MESKDIKDFINEGDIEDVTIDNSKKKEKVNKENENIIQDSSEEKKSNLNLEENSIENQIIPLQNSTISENNSESSDNKNESSDSFKISHESQNDENGNYLSLPKKTETLKIVLLGGNKVGKTSIISRLISNLPKNELDSITQANCSLKTIDVENENKSITFELWDTPNKEIYQTIKKDFYKNVQVIILVYDINNKKTYDEIKNYWIFETKKYSNSETCKLFYNFINY